MKRRNGLADAGRGPRYARPPGSHRSCGSSGCGTTIKDYGFMLREDPAYAQKAARISALAKDISEYLESLGPLKAARETGFFDPRRMRQAFLRRFGLPPQVIRRNARAA